MTVMLIKIWSTWHALPSFTPLYCVIFLCHVLYSSVPPLSVYLPWYTMWSADKPLCLQVVAVRTPCYKEKWVCSCTHKKLLFSMQQGIHNSAYSRNSFLSLHDLFMYPKKNSANWFPLIFWICDFWSIRFIDTYLPINIGEQINGTGQCNFVISYM